MPGRNSHGAKPQDGPLYGEAFNDAMDELGKIAQGDLGPKLLSEEAAALIAVLASACEALQAAYALADDVVTGRAGSGDHERFYSLRSKISEALGIGASDG